MREINCHKEAYYVDDIHNHHFLFSQNEELILTSEKESLFSNSEDEVKVLLPYQERLLEETRRESSDLNKLNIFMAGDFFLTLGREKKDLMYDQVRTMNTKVQILGKRLELEGIQFTHGVDIK